MNLRRRNAKNKDGSMPTKPPNHQESKGCYAGGISPTSEASEAEFRPKLLNDGTSSFTLQANNKNKNSTMNTVTETTDYSNNKTNPTNSEANKDQDMDDKTIYSIDSAYYSVMEQLYLYTRSNNNKNCSDDDNWSDFSHGDDGSFSSDNTGDYQSISQGEIAFQDVKATNFSTLAPKTTLIHLQQTS